MADTITSELLTEEDCYQILGQHISSNAHIMNYNICKADSKVLGYMGDHFRLRIFYRTILENTLQELTFFVKTEPLFNKTQANYVSEMGLFTKENLIYKNLLPKLSALADIQFAPRCYLVNKQCLVFEDLMMRNFSMRGSFLNLKECESLVKCLSKFHCASIVYEELYSFHGKTFRLDEVFGEELRETAFSFVEGQPRNMWLKNNTKCIAECIKLLSNTDNSNEIIEKLQIVALYEMETYISPSLKFRNVVTHCDLWSNNFMINDKLECVLVDFQLARYSPPAYDLLLTLYLNTSKAFLEENIENLLDLYYSTFQEMLLLYKMAPEKLFPRKSFMESVEYFKLPTLLEAVYFSTNTLISKETSTYILADAERYHEFAFTNRSKYIIRELKKNASFRSGILEILMPLIDILEKKK